MRDSERMAGNADGVLAVLQGIAAPVPPFVSHGLVQERVIDGNQGKELHTVGREVGILARPCCMQDSGLVCIVFN